MSDAVPVAIAQNNAPQELKNVVSYLRGKNGPKVRRGVLNGKRVDYFKGKTAMKSLLLPAYKKLKKVPKVENEEEAEALMVKILPHAFFLRTDRPTPEVPTPPGQPKPLNMTPTQTFSRDAYYTWFTPSSPLSTILGGLAMVLVMLAGVMFPLWPPIMRLGVWYLSVGVLGLVGVFIGIAIVRLILWLVTSLFGRGIWWFPRLFDDVGVIDSFIPFWAWDDPPPKKTKRKAKSTSSSKKTSAKSSKNPTPIPGSPAEPETEGRVIDLPPLEADTAPTSEGDDGSAAVKASAVEVNGGGGGRRREAYVEDAEDDE